MAGVSAEATLTEAKQVVPLSTWVLISNFKLVYLLLRRPDGTFNRHLAEFLDRKAPANATPVEGVASMDVEMERARGLWGRLFWPCEQPAEAPPSAAAAAAAAAASSPVPKKPVVVYFHGGSFAHSSANSAIYDALCRRLASLCGVVVVSVNFRRSPEHRYPQPYHDGLAGLRWAKTGAGRACLAALGGDVEGRCFLAGDSSGGNIAHHVAVEAGSEGIALAGTVLLMPMFGGEGRTAAEVLLDGKYFVSTSDRDWYWRAFLPSGSDRDHPACNPLSPRAPPLHSLTLPPSLVVIGGFDLLQDWQLRYVYSLKRAGKHVKLLFLEQATMGFFLLPNTDLFYSLVSKLCEFFSSPQ